MASTTARPAAHARPGPVLAALGVSLALLVVATLLLAPSAMTLAGLGLAAGLAGVGVAAMALRRATAAARALDKLSGEIDVLSARLVRLEAAPAAGRAGPLDALETNVAEVTAEIGLLGGIVRELAVAVEGHDRDLAELREKAPLAAAQVAPPVIAHRPAAAPRPAPVAVPVPEPAALRAAPVVRPPVEAPPIVEPVRLAPADDRALGQREAAIARALDEGRVEVHLQPVVTLPQRRVAFYEAVPRLRLEDGLVQPAAFLGALERRGRVPDLDRFMLARAMTIARHLASRGSGATVALGLAPVSVAEPGFLRAVSRLADAHPDLAARLVLALPQRSWRALDAEAAGALAALCERGVLLALDRAADLRLDPQALAERRVRYVKVPAELLLRPRLSPARSGQDIALADLAASLDRAGIGLIADGVEREDDVPDLLDLDVPFAQGGALAPPRAVRAEVFAPVPAPAPAEAETPAPRVTNEPTVVAPPALEAVADPEVQEPPVRRSFRDFLRRAG